MNPTANQSDIDAINVMIRTAILSDNDGTRLNAVRLAGKRIEKHKLDAHSIGLGQATQQTPRPNPLAGLSVDQQELYSLRAEVGRLKKSIEHYKAEADRYRTAHSQERSNTTRMLAAACIVLDEPIYTDDLYRDQSLAGGVQRRADKVWSYQTRVRDRHRQIATERDRAVAERDRAEAELANLRFDLGRLATKQD